MNGKEACAKRLNTYHESGLWVISETYDGSGLGIYWECLGDDQYNTAVSMPAGLDEYGFSDWNFVKKRGSYYALFPEICYIGTDTYSHPYGWHIMYTSEQTIFGKEDYNGR